MKTKQKPKEQKSKCDMPAPAVAREGRISRADAEVLVKEIGRPHFADILVWPSPSASDQRPQFRTHYGLSLHEAMASAAEALACFESHGRNACLLAVRPADVNEATMYYFALDELGTWEHEATQDGCMPKALGAATGAARGGRTRKPRDWAHTLRAFVNELLNRSKKTLRSGERSGTQAANSLV